jgi:hypothetical protein
MRGHWEPDDVGALVAVPATGVVRADVAHGGHVETNYRTRSLLYAGKLSWSLLDPGTVNAPSSPTISRVDDSQLCPLQSDLPSGLKVSCPRASY